MEAIVVDDSRAMRMIAARTPGQAGLGGHEVLALVAEHSPGPILSTGTCRR